MTSFFLRANVSKTKTFQSIISLSAPFIPVTAFYSSPSHSFLPPPLSQLYLFLLSAPPSRKLKWHVVQHLLSILSVQLEVAAWMTGLGSLVSLSAQLIHLAGRCQLQTWTQTQCSQTYSRTWSGSLHRRREDVWLILVILQGEQAQLPVSLVHLMANWLTQSVSLWGGLKVQQ